MLNSGKEYRKRKAESREKLCIFAIPSDAFAVTGLLLLYK